MYKVLCCLVVFSAEKHVVMQPAAAFVVVEGHFRNFEICRPTRRI